MLPNDEQGVTAAALVVGAGIAGIRAALDIAEAGYRVHLVEREASIGGRMAQLDKTFPTLDCSSCILTPLMVEVGRHPDIVLHTLSEVSAVQRLQPGTETTGQFRVQILHRPRFVDIDACTGCGACARECRMRGRVVDRFNEGLTWRSAAYVPFPQAVPLKYAIDPEACLYLSQGSCGRRLKCREACLAGAIDFGQKERTEEVTVDAIVLSTGFDLLKPTSLPEFGYGQYSQVLTAIEFERMASASGPSAGRIIVDGKEPTDVVFIQCVGSRDSRAGVPYCSRVCCMYTAKHAHLVRERLPNARVTIFYIDVRAFGKGCEEFHDRVRREGTLYRRGEPAEVFRNGDKVVVVAEDTLLGRRVEVPADLVVLATAMVPRADALDVARVFGIDLSSDGYFRELDPAFSPNDTQAPNVFLAGCCQGPKDIPDTVAHAKAAAAAALVALAGARDDRAGRKVEAGPVSKASS